MPQVIPIQPVPSQQVACVLASQNCQIAIYQKNDDVYVDLNSNGTNMSIAVIAHNGVPLDSCNSYDGFEGNLYFIDTQGLDDPLYTGFGSRWILIYLTPAEILLTEIVANLSIPVTIFTLSASLTAISSASGPFSVPHGLSTVPEMIEIIPNQNGDILGEIWAQSVSFDATNIYLEASDTGVEATILVMLAAPFNASFLTPAAVLNVVSPSQPPDVFAWPHGLAEIPSFIELVPASDGEILGQIWAQDPMFDATNVYLGATGAGIAATVNVYPPTSVGKNILAPAVTLLAVSSVAGNFNLLHGLSFTPSRVIIVPLSAGSIATQIPAADSSTVNLVASDGGVSALILVFA